MESFAILDLLYNYFKKNASKTHHEICGVWGEKMKGLWEYQNFFWKIWNKTFYGKKLHAPMIKNLSVSYFLKKKKIVTNRRLS